MSVKAHKPSSFGAIACSMLLVSMGAEAAPKRVATEQALKELGDGAPNAATPSGPLQKAKAALDRAKAMEQSGDARHGTMMRAVADAWIDVARDAKRAAEAEAQAEKAEKALDDAQTRIVRGRALLEETIARRGRARALLEQVEAEKKAAPPSSGKAKPPKPEGKKPAKAATGDE